MSLDSKIAKAIEEEGFLTSEYSAGSTFSDHGGQIILDVLPRNLAAIRSIYVIYGKPVEADEENAKLLQEMKRLGKL